MPSNEVRTVHTLSHAKLLTITQVVTVITCHPLDFREVDTCPRLHRYSVVETRFEPRSAYA